jgi:hypothetical protein
MLKSTIKVSKQTKTRLLKFKTRDTECFDDIINRILDEKDIVEYNSKVKSQKKTKGDK